ncbi:hypothetical protein NMY22_g8677 [Coprinellus aureogranulatus]|nr:hypothetical protein NMY22_g8677 [Coprinellus aureogranulatus]
MSAPSEAPLSSGEQTSNDNAPPTGTRPFLWPLPRFLLPIHGGGLHAAITERIARAAEDAAREGRRRCAAESNEMVGPTIDATHCDLRHPGPQTPGPPEENDEQGSEGSSPPPPGSPVPSDPPEVMDNFPEVHLALLPNIEVAAFLQRRGVAENRMAEHRIPGAEETLLRYSDSVEAWELVSEVSFVLVLPRNGLTRLLLVGILEAPVASVIVLSGLGAILFNTLETFIPEHIIYDFFLLPIIALAKILACCLLYALRVVLLGVWRFAGHSFAVAGRSSRICLVSVLNIVVKYLDELREAQVEQLAAL